VRVYAGKDPLSGRRHDLVQIVPPGPEAPKQAERVRTAFLAQLDEQRNPKTRATVNQLMDRYEKVLDVDRTTKRTYLGYSKKHIRPLLGKLQVGRVDGELLDSFYAELRRCREHCDGGKSRVDHRTTVQHECDDRCGPHQCKPLSASTIRQIHWILSGAFDRADRWGWVSRSPMRQAQPPAAPSPDPQPPSAEEAGRILGEASKDPDWGTFVWLAMITGARRGELCGLRWQHIDFATGTITLRRSVGQDGSTVFEKDTKTHQQRRVTIDGETVDVLQAQRDRCAARAEALGVQLPSDAYVFSLSPAGEQPLTPDAVSQRYRKLATRLGIKTTLHKLRHYSATELIAAGVDIRTVAGRLGHGGGGTTTLRVYAAWVSEADQRASERLASRLRHLRLTDD
jgi:integrase